MEQVLFHNPYLAIIERDGYTFSHEVRCKGIIVAVVPFRRTGTTLEFLARRAICPAHGQEFKLCSVTGGLEPGQTVVETAQQEVWEETGYRVEAQALLPLGQVRPSKSADTWVHLFAVEVTHQAQYPPPGDGSALERDASVQWLSYEQGLHITDPLFVTAMARLHWLITSSQQAWGDMP